MILLIDNYDSFVHNLARYVERLGHRTLVVRNDQVDAAGAARLAPEAVILSPGPCTPVEAGCSIELVQRLEPSLPILGVCLGHQAIAVALGGRVARATTPMHGRTSPIEHHGRGLFEGLASPLSACRYHSLVVEESSLPDELSIDARSPDGDIMALSSQNRPLFGLQFHPEAILTDGGYRLLSNFLRAAGLPAPPPSELPQDELRPRQTSPAPNLKSFATPPTF